MTKQQASEITGGLSKPSKMPGYAWGIPAQRCITGSKLAKIPGSTCSKCCAMKNFYVMPNVKAAYQRRFERMFHPDWVEAMVVLIESTKEPYFRFKDSGDLQHVDELKQIVAVCVRLPHRKFWLPTREYKIVQEHLKAGGQIPENLVIRLSAHMMDAEPPSGYGLPTSTVHTSEAKEPKGAKICRAYQNNNFCGDCRACWNPEVSNVSYLEH